MSKIRFNFYSLAACYALLMILALVYIDRTIVDNGTKASYQQVEQELLGITNKLTFNLYNNIQVVKGLPSLVSLNPSLTQQQFSVAVKPIFDGSNQLRNIGFAPDLIIKHMYPIKGNEAAIGLDYRTVPLQLKSALKAKDSRQLILDGPLKLVQGNMGLVSRIPVFITDTKGTESFWGMISAVIDVEKLYEHSGLFSPDLSIELAIRKVSAKGEAGAVFFGDPNLFNQQHVESTIELPSTFWQIAAQPVGGWKHLPEGIWTKRLYIGIAALTLFALFVVFLKALMRSSSANDRFQTIFSQSPIGIAVIDSHTWHIYDVNPAYAQIAGRSIEELRTLDWMKITHLDDMQDDLNNMAKMNAGVISGFTMRKRFIRPDESIRWFNMTVTPLLVEDNNKPRHLCMVEDITQRYHAESELKIAATVFESQEGMLVTDANNIILRVNHAFTKITGYSAEEAVGQTPRILSSGRQNKAFYDAMWDSINDTGTWEGEIWNRRKSGEVYPEHLTISAVKDDAGITTNFVATLTDITMSKAASDEIKNLAFYDPLTQLPNRRLLMDRLSQALASSARSGQRGAVLFMDLDHFKTLNDTLGHDYGDLLLQQVAERLTANVRADDTVSRLGGDEFVVLLEDLSEEAIEAGAYTEDVAEKIILALNQPYQLKAHTHHSTPSIGATLFNGHEQGLEELLKQADIAMYQSKTEGRNTLRFFDPKMQEAIASRVDMQQELRKAIEQHQFELHYQIQVGADGKAIGAEALIRWQHPKRGMISPFNFIPLAEETGLILPIGQWVLETACAQLKSWEKNELTQHLTLSVNVSAKQFHQEHFVEQVLETIERHAIHPAHLKLELTESLLVENVNDIVAKMSALNDAGIRFELDDFGTGYSSLQYLKKLPIDQLKIDQSFVRDIAIDSSDRTLVRTIITMAQSLDINVIAEGVETEDQHQFLKNNGCLHYQGYLFGKPVQIDVFEGLLAKS